MNLQIQQTAITVTQNFGISPHLKGYHYIKDAAVLALQNPNIATMRIYQIIGERYHKNAASIEHSIRYAVRLAYNINHLNNYFPYTERRPSNSEVIWTLAENVRMYNVRQKICTFV